ncbi:MAG: hypothetical protein GTN76_04680 [Candidatus Aenigmarchaeota archaeon]|nr:hypothetical protein [Candidatus Aenigmarchaeota archaeon]
MEVEVETEIIKGVTYYFCCEECEETFETQDDKDQPICT